MELFAPADGDLAEEGEQVVRYAAWILAHDAARVRAGGVEVAQESADPAGVCVDVVLDR